MAMSEGERHLAEWQFGMASHFFTALFAALTYADNTNQARLSLAFPEEVNAFQRYRKETGYWQRIEAEWRSSFPRSYRPSGAKEAPLMPMPPSGEGGKT